MRNASILANIKLRKIKKQLAKLDDAEVAKIYADTREEYSRYGDPRDGLTATTANVILDKIDSEAQGLMSDAKLDFRFENYKRPKIVSVFLAAVSALPTFFFVENHLKNQEIAQNADAIARDQAAYCEEMSEFINNNENYPDLSTTPDGLAEQMEQIFNNCYDSNSFISIVGGKIPVTMTSNTPKEGWESFYYDYVNGKIDIERGLYDIANGYVSNFPLEMGLAVGALAGAAMWCVTCLYPYLKCRNAYKLATQIKQNAQKMATDVMEKYEGESPDIYEIDTLDTAEKY